MNKFRQDINKICNPFVKFTRTSIHQVFRMFWIVTFFTFLLLKKYKSFYSLLDYPVEILLKLKIAATINP